MNRENLPIYRIHPAVGVARLGNSPDEFCISPEKPATLPLACDDHGNTVRTPDGESEMTVDRFKDSQGGIKRQAARFRVYVYDEESPEGRELHLGDPVAGGGNQGTLVDIQWRVYLANKKAVWYEFHGLDGEHGYLSSDRRRNADITGPNERQRLIIDPGPQVVNSKDRRRVRFDAKSGLYAATFPPKLTPHSIENLGEILTDDEGRLLVLGGHGYSGSIYDGFGEPRIDNYANNDGWFDDTSDGPVMARLVMYSQEVGRLRFIDVEYPAWVVCAYPAYVPEILDLVTLDDVILDLSIRQFAYRTDLYGTAGTFDCPERVDPADMQALLHWQAGPLLWNPDHKPWFYRDIWPILFRPDEMTYLTNVLQQSNFPHNQSRRGNFDPNKLSIPPVRHKKALRKRQLRAIDANQSGDLFVDALEPALMVVEDQWQQTQHPRMLGFEAALTEDVREALRKTAEQFAGTVLPERPVGEPDDYWRAWRKVYEEAGTAYEAAVELFDSQVHGILEDLYGRAQQPKREEKPKLAPLAAFVREPEEPSGPESGLSGEALADRVGKEFRTGKLLQRAFEGAAKDCTYDPFRDYRTYLYELLRRPGEENEFRLGGKPTNRLFNLPLMPLLAGDNPDNNNLPSKFLRLTDYQLYLLRQWAEGKFYNEYLEEWVDKVDPYNPYSDWSNKTGRQLDQGVLMNMLGGAFFPGGEIGWISRNPSSYKAPYRLKADPDFYTFRQTAAQSNANSRQLTVPEQDYVSETDVALSQDTDLATGLQPGDVTKMMPLPWQADFNECSTQDINITYELWNKIDPSSENDPWMAAQSKVWETLWWPAHRPMQTWEVVDVQNGSPVYQYLSWARGVPQTLAGDLKMVTEWSRLGFVIRNPYLSPEQLNSPSPDTKYISVERNSGDA